MTNECRLCNVSSGCRQMFYFYCIEMCLRTSEQEEKAKQAIDEICEITFISSSIEFFFCNFTIINIKNKSGEYLAISIRAVNEF